MEKDFREFDPIKLAQDSLAQFMLFTDPFAQSPHWAYVIKEFHRKIIDALEKVDRWEIKKLMISTPAQHGKSSLSSVWYAAWSLWKNPYQHVWVISYSSELSEWFSRRTRELLRSDLYCQLFWDILSPDSQSIKEWNTTKWGSYTAVWVWGSYTGKPAHKIIIDDPHKDQEEASSKLMRDKVWDWYTSVPTTRITSLTSVIVIMTRWHEDDLCWRLLEREWRVEDWWEWTVLNIPVFNEDWTVIRPERHPKELIDSKRKTQWEAMFQAMYMWDPINEWGGDFKIDYFQYYEKWELFKPWGEWYNKDMQVVTFIDPAISQKQNADDTSIVTAWLDKKNNNVYIIDIRRGKMLPDDIINNVFQVVNMYKPEKVWIETNQFQKMLELEIRKEMRKRNTFFILEWQPSTMNKEAKIKTVLQNRYANASILHPKNWVHIGELESQLLKFPNGKHDDIIDSEAMAVMMLNTFVKYKSQWVVKADWTWWKEETPSQRIQRLKKKARIVED